MKPRFVALAKTFLPFLSAAVALRCDSIAFARSFEFLEKDLQVEEYAPTKAEQFIPYDTSVPPGAMTVTHRLVSQVGKAKWVDGYAGDLPIVDVKAQEFSVDCRTFGVKYHWTLEELDAVAMDPTVRLDVERKKSASDACRRFHDEVAAIGSAEFGRKGFINATVVPLVTPITGTWSSATDDQVIADVQKLIEAPRVATLDNHQADTLLVGDLGWARLNRPYGDNKTYTLRKWLLENIDGLKEIAVWDRLNLANAAGNGQRIMAYKKSKEVVKYFSVITFKEEAPQPKDLRVDVPCRAKSGFTNFRIPLAAAYMDGI